MNRMRNYFCSMVMMVGLLGLNSEVKANPIVARALGYPFLTASAAIGSFGAYCMYVRSCCNDWNKVINEAEKLTFYLTNRRTLPDQYKYWKLEEWEHACDIREHAPDVCKEFVSKKPSSAQEASFILKQLEFICAEKPELERMAKRLEECLKECTLFPRLKLDLTDQEKSHPVIDLINTKTKRQRLYTLSQGEFMTLDKAIRAMCSVPVWNPYKMLRHYALPFEAYAIREYWKINQLIARLDAFKDCLEKRLPYT